MTPHTARRRMRPVALAAATLGALMLVLGAAAPAGAAVTVSPGPTYTAGQSVTVSGTGPATATRYALAECVVTDAAGSPVTPGTRCTPIGATAPAALSSGSFSGVSFTLVQNWTSSRNYTIPGSPAYADSVDCDYGTTPGAETCAIVVSYYNAAFVPLTPDVYVLT